MSKVLGNENTIDMSINEEIDLILSEIYNSDLSANSNYSRQDLIDDLLQLQRDIDDMYLSYGGI